MADTKTIEALALNPMYTYVLGWYIQDFENKQMVDRKTGEVSFLSLHRVLLQTVNVADTSRWGAESDGAYGKCAGGFSVSETSIPLADICYLFGFMPNDPKFNLIECLDKLVGHAVNFNVGFDNKGRTKIRGISVLT